MLRWAWSDNADAAGEDSGGMEMRLGARWGLVHGGRREKYAIR